ncbi:hypothetical protein [Vreelandella boliviensis]|uniref:Uncharacterized protein n=1 Tax=Vreelandella boliviensis LC1 TaxID=1072583 RepID=A0A265DX20_9GAMM|nr:hypothetical protein [Halomonas boliviensis]EHJ91090.1 hypothetical protein KUC_3933 [Halomonas boliviensis LC1]OZT73884.1 hypothetical protein CE457_12930 [Halomonas boliviensis LC1]
MGTSFNSWDEVAAYFMFADKLIVLIILAFILALMCVGLVASIKRHEDEAFAEHLNEEVKKTT